MSGHRLEEMEMSEMLDILHFLMEEDFTPSSAESAEARSALRESVYRDMYGRPYAYAMKKDKKKSTASYGVPENNYVSPTSDLDNLSNESPFDPRTAPPKPFVPATDFDPDAKNPYQGILDAPLG